MRRKFNESFSWDARFLYIVNRKEEIRRQQCLLDRFGAPFRCVKHKAETFYVEAKSALSALTRKDCLPLLSQSTSVVRDIGKMCIFYDARDCIYTITNRGN